jgi:cell division transport system permease protein
MKPDFTFAKDDAHQFLPWHIGIMVALATLLLCLVLSLGQWVGSHQGDYADSVSVILPGTLDKLDDKTAQVKGLLAREKGVSAVEGVSESALRTMLTPWIGDGEALSDMQLPVVLDVKINPATFDADTLKAHLAEVSATIELDAHNDWAAVFASFVRILQGLAVFLALTVLGAMALMIVFSARASLHLHERTVNLLHGMGAEDRYIARQFQQEHFKIGLRAALIGVGIAVIAYLLLGLCVSAIDTPIIPQFVLAMPHYILIAIMPFACAFIALAATRYSVMSQLERVL